ncbi:hypothetical protein GALMADRAFT_637600 [Galerina marginata CBS 339.88]|uniref:Extracellular membrane protein CFEM domain-containing protein n=1 Tax=Galerina marginata (strain CBS 339.88) TaxID=685588 RepID=A0A067TTY4_GALM3|nr:hypothetical protein GALMADRAFT_637600 [Galerina marginata CBS 339.88]
MALKFLLVALAAISLANAFNLTSTGCADAAGFQSCQNAVADATSACLAQADKDHSSLESLACGCTYYVFNYNCYAEHCWNRVNECEYQAYVAQYLVQCPNAKLPVPYFPTPSNPPDSCSCNLGEVLLEIDNGIQQSTTCTSNAAGNVQKIQGCKCCEASAALSSIYGLCPDTNPSLVGLDQVNTIEKLLGTNFTSCSSSLS